MEYKGRIWFIKGDDGKLIDDIDTDMIFHNAHLAITEVSKMGQHAFGNLKGYEDFPDKVNVTISNLLVDLHIEKLQLSIRERLQPDQPLDQ